MTLLSNPINVFFMYMSKHENNTEISEARKREPRVKRVINMFMTKKRYDSVKVDFRPIN